MTTENAQPPRAEKRPVRTHHHGMERVEHYTWLRADNWQEVRRNAFGIAKVQKSLRDVSKQTTRLLQGRVNREMPLPVFQLLALIISTQIVRIRFR